jgi:hypothetical protein
VRRLVAALICALFALPGVALAAAPDPLEDHRDTARELQIDLAQEVAATAADEQPQTAATAQTLPTSWCGAPTTSDDTADAAQSQSLPQFKLVYAYAADGTNRFAQWDDALQANVAIISQFLSQQSHGLKAPRFDMGTSCGPQYADIATVALPQNSAAYVDHFEAVRDDVLAALGLPAAGKPRDVVILADKLSGSGQWGIGALYPDDRPDAANWHNNADLASVIWVPAATNPPASSADGYWPEGFLHEMTHNMGGVQWSAPHNTAPHQPGYFHCWDGNDVMCYHDGPLAHTITTACSQLAAPMPQVYDCNGDDYFNPSPAAGSYLATHWNVFNSVMLADCATLGAACGADADLPSATTAPTVTGTARVGRTLTGTQGVWQNAVGLARQWQHDTGGGYVDIPGATGLSYTLTSADLGASVRLTVTASNPSGSQTASTLPLGPVAAPQPPVVWASPSIAGVARRGSTLAAAAGAWSGISGADAIGYTWERQSGGAWAAIPNAASSTYTLTADDVGTNVRVRVRATNADGATEATSAPLGPVAEAVAAPPTTQPTIGPPTITRPTTIRRVALTARALRLALRGTGTTVRVPLSLTPSADGARYSVALPATKLRLRPGRWRVQLCVAGVCTTRTIRAKRSIVLLPALKAPAVTGQTVRITLTGPGRRLAGSARA